MSINWADTFAAVWRAKKGALKPVSDLDPVRLSTLVGIETQKQAIIDNTLRFIDGLPANNVLMWGARGTGKSSIVKALLNEFCQLGLRVVQIEKEDLSDLVDIADELRQQVGYRFVIYCDDMSFEPGDDSYKGLKTILEGSIERPPRNVIVMATSNRRHLVPEYQHENDLSRVHDTEVHHADVIEEKLALADRFGLWLSFYPISQSDYFAIVDQLFDHVNDRAKLHVLAARFAISKGGRSGRTAEQFHRAYCDKNI